MKLLTVSLTFLALLSMGCQKTVVTELTVSPPASDSTVDGTIDSGGGNSVGGRPIDSYAFDPFGRDEIKDTIVPMITQLAKTHLKFAGALYNILREKTWYLVPVELNKLSAKEIGVSFPNDQMALQTRREVYIASKLFNPAAEEDRATLIVHELLMGMRIYRFNNDRYLCIAKVTTKLLDGSSYEEFKKAKDQCYRDFPSTGKDDLFNKISLTTDDYELIRGLTARLMRHSEDVSDAELDSWLIDAHLMEPSESKFFNTDGTLNSLGISSLAETAKLN
jgi:hypothetical protein